MDKFTQQIARWMLAGFVGVGSLVATTDAATAAANPSVLPSVECNFTEPFFALLVSPEGLVILDEKTTAAQFVSADIADPARIRYTFRVKGKLKTLTLVNDLGTDGMSDADYDRRGEWESFVGGCTMYQKGMVPRRVVKVAADDVLNIRNKPNAGAAVVRTASNAEVIFVQAPESKSQWKKVAVTIDVGESSRIRVIKGWANGAFIAKKPPAQF
jgi:uncharacterized membrane protein